MKTETEDRGVRLWGWAVSRFKYKSTDNIQHLHGFC